MFTILFFIAYSIGLIFVGSRYQPWISKRDGIWYLDYSSKRGQRDQKKLF